MTREEIIEKAKKICFSSNPQDYIKFVGELAELKLEQLPDNLDKAAEEYIEKRASLAPNEPWDIEDMRAAVRFGATWMAEQGNNYVTTIKEDGSLPIDARKGYPSGFKSGDKVIVQIRKAE